MRPEGPASDRRAEGGEANAALPGEELIVEILLAAQEVQPRDPFADGALDGVVEEHAHRMPRRVLRIEVALDHYQAVAQAHGAGRRRDAAADFQRADAQ